MFRVQGRTPLVGSVSVAGAKNAALPILAASLLAHDDVILTNVPRLTDIDHLALLLGYLGVEVKRLASGALWVRTVDEQACHAEPSLVQRMRGSVCLLGPLLARRGRACLPLPGGCALGERPIDLHLKGLAALGADLRIENGLILAEARELRGARIHLVSERGSTVTGTANVLTAATVARGHTTITGAACEPEIVDLGRFLICLGARIEGLGTSCLEIDGVSRLGQHATPYTVMPDRIEAGTWLLAGAITGGDVTVEGVQPGDLTGLLDKLTSTGLAIEVGTTSIRGRVGDPLQAVDYRASPHPGLPTDLQPLWTVLACVTRGTSTIKDDVFPQRWSHLAGLEQLGARWQTSPGACRVAGGGPLRGTWLETSDLRGAGALTLAALAATGESTIVGLEHLRRGYQDWLEKLACLGAPIGLEDPPDSLLNRGAKPRWWEWSAAFANPNHAAFPARIVGI